MTFAKVVSFFAVGASVEGCEKRPNTASTNHSDSTYRMPSMYPELGDWKKFQSTLDARYKYDHQMVGGSYATMYQSRAQDLGKLYKAYKRNKVTKDKYVRQVKNAKTGRRNHRIKAWLMLLMKQSVIQPVDFENHNFDHETMWKHCFGCSAYIQTEMRLEMSEIKEFNHKVKGAKSIEPDAWEEVFEKQWRILANFSRQQRATRHTQKKREDDLENKYLEEKIQKFGNVCYSRKKMQSKNDDNMLRLSKSRRQTLKKKEQKREERMEQEKLRRYINAKGRRQHKQ